MHMGAVSGLPALPSYPLYSQVSEEESGKPDTVLKSHWPPEHQLMVLSLITVSKVKIWTHLLGRHCNKGLDDFIFSHMKFQVNYTCTVLCYFGNTGTNLMILIFFVVFFFYKSGAINIQIIHLLKSTFTTSKELRWNINLSTYNFYTD